MTIETIRKRLNSINFFYLFQQSLKYGRDHKIKFTVYIVLFLFSSILTALNPWAIAYAINHLIDKQLDKVLLGVAVFLGLKAGQLGCHYTARYIQRNLAFRVSSVIFQLSVLDQVISLPFSWHEKKHSGEHIKIINRAGEALKRFLEELSSNMLTAVFDLVFALSLLFVLSIKVGLLITAVLVVYITVALLFNKKLVKIYSQTYVWENKLSVSVLDGLTNIFTLNSLRLKEPFLQKIRGVIPEGIRLTKKKVLTDELKWASGDLISIGIILLCFYVYYSDIVSGEALAGIGGLYILVNYFMNIQSSLSKFSWLYSEIVEKAAAVRCLDPIQEASITFSEHKKESGGHQEIGMWNSLKIKNLEHLYSPHSGLKTIPLLEIKRGENIAIVGKSGSGKSTLLKLLAGVYETEVPSLSADGKSVPFQSLAEQSILVPQEAEIFHDTIRYNIFMGTRLNPTFEQKIIEMLSLDDLLKRLPQGMETVLEEKGVNISGGEKQRIALARSLATGRDKDILLLDESTSSVDSQIEEQIFRHLLVEEKNKTIVSAMHRLSNIKLFHRIIVLDRGHLVGEGTFQELYRDCPTFRLLWEFFSNDKKK